MDPIQSPTWLRQPLSDHEQGTPVGEEPPPLFFVRGALDETVEFIRRKIGLPQEGEQKQEEPELTEEQVKKARDELKWMRHILIYHFKETIDHPSSNNDEPLQPGLVEALEYLWLDAYVANPEVRVFLVLSFTWCLSRQIILNFYGCRACLWYWKMRKDSLVLPLRFHPLCNTQTLLRISSCLMYGTQ